MAPLQMGKGTTSMKQIVSCTHNLLGFPANARANTISYILDRYNISTEEVYSIERSYWYYIWPLYSNNCTIVKLNNKFSGKLPQQRKKTKLNKGLTIKDCHKLDQKSRVECIKSLN
jgi:hypothetical protein